MDILEFYRYAERLGELVITHGSELIRTYGRTPEQILADGGFRVNVRDFRSMILDYGLSEEEAFSRTMDWMYRQLA